MQVSGSSTSFGTAKVGIEQATLVAVEITSRSIRVAGVSSPHRLLRVLLTQLNGTLGGVRAKPTGRKGRIETTSPKLRSPC